MEKKDGVVWSTNVQPWRRSKRLTAYLQQSSKWVLTLYAAATSCTIYLIIYGFRRPWTSGDWGEQKIFGLNRKVAMQICQTMGIVLGKASTVYVASNLQDSSRFSALCGLPLLSVLMWIGVGLTYDTTWGPLLFIFFTAAPLAYAWSLLYRYLEGRSTGDFLGAVLSSAMIFGSGIAKSLGGAVEPVVGSQWMPTACCFLLLPIYLAACYLIDSLPPPSSSEQEKYGVRQAMSRAQQREFFVKYWPGLLPTTVSYVLLSAIKDFRDTFQAEIFSEAAAWNGKGEGLEGGGLPDPATYTATEVPVTVFILFALSSLNLIEDSGKSVIIQYILQLLVFVALLPCLSMSPLSGILLLNSSRKHVNLLGLVLCILSQLLFNAEYLSVGVWYVAIGIGSFLAFLPTGSMLYDRLMGAIKQPGTAVFMINISDTAGYSGTILLLLFQSFGSGSYLLVEDQKSGGVTGPKSRGTYTASLGTFIIYGCSLCALSLLWALVYWGRTILRIRSGVRNTTSKGTTAVAIDGGEGDAGVGVGAQKGEAIVLSSVKLSESSEGMRRVASNSGQAST